MPLRGGTAHEAAVQRSLHVYGTSGDRPGGNALEDDAGPLGSKTTVPRVPGRGVHRRNSSEPLGEQGLSATSVCPHLGVDRRRARHGSGETGQATRLVAERGVSGGLRTCRHSSFERIQCAKSEYMAGGSEETQCDWRGHCRNFERADRCAASHGCSRRRFRWRFHRLRRRVRNHDGGKSVTGLTYTAHSAAQEILQGAITDVATRFDVVALAAVHRIGQLQVGDVAVVVAASGAHRDAAFPASRALIEEIKFRSGKNSFMPTAQLDGSVPNGSSSTTWERRAHPQLSRSLPHITAWGTACAVRTD